MIICDTSGLIAAYSAKDPRRARVEHVLSGDRGARILSPLVLAELDYLVSASAGTWADLTVLGDVAAGVYQLAEFDCFDVAQAAAVAARYQDMGMGLADASIVILAARYRTTRLLTLDERHFRAIKPLNADAFTILPTDEPG